MYFVLFIKGPYHFVACSLWTVNLKTFILLSKVTTMLSANDALPDDMDDMMDNGPDMMDIMKQTANQLKPSSEQKPNLLPQSTMNVNPDIENDLRGRPITHKSPSPNQNIIYKSPPPNQQNGITTGPTINMKSVQWRDESQMDDDLDNYDAKDDLTQEQQKLGIYIIYHPCTLKH